MLLDGSIAQLLAGKVVLRGQTLTIPKDISSAQPIVVGGQSITAQPGDSKKPDSNDHEGGHGGGGGGPFAMLGKIVGAAGSAAKSIGNLATDAVGFAAGAAGTGSAAADALAGSLSTAVNGAGGVVSSLNGIQKAFPLDSLTKAGMNTFLGAQNLGRNSVDWMRSTGKLLESFDTLKPEVQQQVRDSIRDYSKPDGPLQQAAAAMKSLADFPWEAEAPTTKLPSPTATPQPTKSAQVTKATSAQSSRVTTSTSAKTTSTTISSSSTAPSPTAQVLPYYIATKWDTPVEVFNQFIKDLDGGAGKAQIGEDGIMHQIYETNLTSSQADGLEAKYPFILIAYADVCYPKDLDSSEEEFHAIPKSSIESPTAIKSTEYLLQNLKNDTVTPYSHSLSSRGLLPGDRDAPYWKKMISSPFQDPLLRDPSQDPPYVTDDSEGKGTTIYVLDDGFDINRPVSFTQNLTWIYLSYEIRTSICMHSMHLQVLHRSAHDNVVVFS
jgi:hypothetical protein